MAYLTFSLRDWSAEYGNFSLGITEPAGGDLVSTLTAKQSAVETAVEGVTLGTVARKGIVIAQAPKGDDVAPASQLAQREQGIRLFLEGDTDHQKVTITIPTPDVAALTIPVGSDEITLADAGVMAALVTALEANCVLIQDDSTTDTFTVVKAMLVGRNS